MTRDPDPTPTSDSLLRDETPAVFHMDDVAMGTGAAIEDLDGDGDLDIALADVFGRRTVLFANQGDGEFLDVTSTWANAVPQFLSTRFADFNGDGNVDFLLPSRKVSINVQEREALWLAFGRGDGTFDTQAAAVFGADVTGSIKGTAVIDLDADGDLDAVGCFDAWDTTDRVMFAALWNNGELSAAPHRIEALTDPPTPGCTQGAMGDFDGDLDLDYLACGEQFWLYENVDGFFQLTESTGLPTNEVTGCNSIDWVDFDGDGDLDVAFQNKEKIFDDEDPDHRPVHGTVIYRNDTPIDGDPVFVRVPALDEDLSEIQCPRLDQTVELPTLTGGARAGNWFDADLDGDLDLFLPQPFPVCFSDPILYENASGNGTRFVAHIVPTYGAMAGPTGVASGDIDGDGDEDLIANDFVYSQRTLFRNYAVENRAADGDPQAHWLEVQVVDRHGTVVPAAVVQMDLDGPNEAPDFMGGSGQLAVRQIAPTGRESAGPAVARFARGTTEPVWLRTRLPDGQPVLQLVTEWDQRVVLAP